MFSVTLLITFTFDVALSVISTDPFSPKREAKLPGDVKLLRRARSFCGTGRKEGVGGAFQLKYEA